jgi:hypothetical protein
MAISYPLNMPSHTGIRGVQFRTLNAVAYSRSPFTFAGKAYAFAGQMLEADISLPPMARADAERWLAWLISLRGQVGTFYLGDPLSATPMGSARDADTILVRGAVSSGGVIKIDSAPASETDYLKAGDYMQIGSGSSRQLFKILTDVSTNSSGRASVDVWPNVRTSIANDSAITVESAKGLFRLSVNEQSWDINEASIYGINFSAMEAL